MDNLKNANKINIAKYITEEYKINVKDDRPLSDIVLEKIKKGLIKKRQGQYIFIG